MSVVAATDIQTDSSHIFLPDFVNKSEKIMSDFLNLCDFKWAYEPKTFTFNDISSGVYAFAPDFFVDGIGYIEVTASLYPGPKNKKMRKMETEYPYVNIFLARFRGDDSKEISVYHGYNGRFGIKKGEPFEIELSYKNQERFRQYLFERTSEFYTPNSIAPAGLEPTSRVVFA